MTRFLCAAAYNHRAFRDGMLLRLVSPSERFLPPAYGVDPCAVAWHCVRAQRLDAAREMAAVAVLGVALCVEPFSALFFLYVATAVRLRRLWRTRWRRTGQKPSVVRRLALASLTSVVVSSWALYAALLGFAVWSAAGGSWGQAPSAALTEAARVTGTWMLAGLPAALGVVSAAERAVRRRRWEEIRRAPGLRPRLDWVLWRHVETRTSRGLRRLAELELLAHVEYADDAFYGAGEELEQFPAWSFATHLRRKPTAPEQSASHLRLVKPPAEHSGPLLVHTEVVDAIREGMQRFQAIEPRRGARLQQLTLRDYVFAPHGHPSLIGRAPAVDVLADEDEEARHMLGIRVGSWEEDLSTTTFVRATTDGDILYLEASVRVLLPVQRRYRRSIRTIAPGMWAAAFCIPRDILRAWPAQTALLLRRFRLVWRPATPVAERSQAQAEGWDVPAAPMHINALREEVAERHPHNLFQRLDIERYIKSVEHRLVSSIKDLLEQKGLESDEFSARVSQVFNAGVINTGGVQSGSIAGAGHSVEQTNQTTVHHGAVPAAGQPPAAPAAHPSPPA
ncbi:hypothetical protein [Streptomyces sp. NPDC051677]|uniref:hypothetical protein n=1 Tax=Streptomyces sp. NPDC051677 TaxID=3365669 RepID=UPI0037D12658